MNETKQSTQTQESKPTRSIFWGTIALDGLALLVFGYFFAFLQRVDKTPVVYVGMAIFLATFLAALSSLILTIRGRQKLGTEIVLYSLSALGVTMVAVFQGRTPTASLSILTISIITVFYLLPKQSRRWYVSVIVVSFIMMWVIEWINPVWRIQLTAATVGPAATVVFGIILAALLIRESWSVISNNLRYKMLAAFIGVTLVVVVSLGTYFNNRLLNVLSQKTQQNLSQLADQTAREVDNFIGNQLTAISVESKDPLFIQYLALDPTVRTGTAAEANAQDSLAILAHRDATNINSYTLLDKNGKIVLDTANRLGEDDSQAGFFKNTISQNQATVTGPLFDQKTGKASLYFSVPVKSRTGTTLGVLVADYDANVIESLVETLIPAGNPDTILFRVVDKENFVRIAHTANLSLLYKPYKNIPADQIVALQKQNLLPPGSSKDVLAAENDTVAGLENAAQTPYFVTTSKTLGALTLNTAAELKTVPWLALVRQSNVTVTKPLQQQTQTIVIIASILLVLVSLASFAFSQILTSPILNLTTVAQKIAAGDLNTRIEIRTQDEIGFLASTFNKMTDQLNDLIGSLEQRVAARTRNLELAAEVGRSVSQVRALDVMLKDASELILKEFNLYYVQVYLADPSQTTLKLEAGTGTVGAQLVGRGHSLPLNTSSINGRAATEKRSVVISDTTKSATFRQNPLLPDTRGEMAVPLIVANKVVGVLDMQSIEPGVLNTEILPAFEALAGQLAVAIQNANLVAETEQARAQVESQARRLVREGWDKHMDAIHKPEQLGFVFEHDQVTSLTDVDESQLPEGGKAISAPIAVTGEALGSLVVELADEASREQTNELVNVIARQVAQQIDNLRLLESAERYRYEAEQASRRLTREGWIAYTEKAGESLKYIYDLNEVRPLNGDTLEAAATVPLKVGDEVVGKFAIQGLDTNDSEAVNLANTVAERLSAHIEGLRQFDQTQSALAQSEKLFDGSRRLTQANNLQELVKAVAETMNVAQINRAVLATFNYNTTGNLETMDVVANWWNKTGHEPTSIGTRYTSDVIRIMPMFVSPIPVFFQDLLNDERSDPATVQIAERQNIRGFAALPLRVAEHQIGVLFVESETPHNFTAEETRLFEALAPQITTVLENRRQYEQAQKQAARESTLNVISQKIQSATSVEAVLQIAARELGHALGAPMTVAQLSMKDKS